MAANPILTFGQNKRVENYLASPGQPLMKVVRLIPSTTFLAGTILGQVTQTEIQVITLTSATGGTFTLTLSGQTTGAIAYNAAASAVQTAIAALSNVGSGNVVVTGADGGPFTATFANSLGNLAQMTATDSTTGSGHGVAVTTSTQGTATSGMFGPYASGNTDGSQVAKCILPSGCVTDASGNITYGTGSILENPLQEVGTACYFSGTFRTEELVGLDATALVGLNGTVKEGTLSSGWVRIG